MPHAGTYVPPALAARFTDEARQVPDTDWHMERLYAFAKDMGASILVATHSRYVVDLNRSPDGASLYPGQSVTGLCPVDTFDDTPLYRDPADLPTEAEIAARFNRSSRRGLAGYFRVAAASLDLLRASRFAVTTETERRELEALTLTVANGQQFGGHALIAPRARLDDGRLDLTTVSESGGPRSRLGLLEAVKD